METTPQNDVKDVFDLLGKQLQRHFNDIIRETSMPKIEMSIRDKIATLSSECLDNQCKSKRDFFLHNTISSIFSVILLYKRGFVKELARNPHEFIATFITSFAPLTWPPAWGDYHRPPNENYRKNTEKISVHELRENLKKTLHTINRETWAWVSKTPAPLVSLLYWTKLDLSPLSPITGKTYLDYLCSKLSKKKEIEAELSPKGIDGNYNAYLKSVHSTLQTRVFPPDLVLIDTIRVAEYREKGVFDAIGLYIKGKEKEITRLAPCIELLGKTVNGRLDAIPLTRNFHLPAISGNFLFPSELGIEIKRKKVNPEAELKIETLLGKDSAVGSKNRNLWNDVGDNKSLVGIFRPIGDVGQIPPKKFHVLNIPHRPFIPMQAARGAHIAYTFFAYMAGVNSDSAKTSFLRVEPYTQGQSLQLSIWKDTLLLKGILDFLETVYTYVPFIALCTEHTIASWIRNHFPQYWFDPCLPIEATRFDFAVENRAQFLHMPTIGRGGSPMSCIGGFCLALSNDSYNKIDAAEAALALMKKTFDSSVEDINNTELKKPINSPSNRNLLNLLIHTIDSETQKPGEYFDIPSSIAKRPAFYEWHALEDLIGRIVRRYVFAVLVYRVIVSESLLLRSSEGKINICDSYGLDKIKLDQLLDIYEHQSLIAEEIINEQRVKALLVHVREYTKGFLDSIDEAKVDEGHENHRFGMPLHNWIETNYDDFETDCLGILSALKTAIAEAETYIEAEKRKKPGEEIEDYSLQRAVLKRLSQRMTESLVSRIKNKVVASGWYFNQA